MTLQYAVLEMVWNVNKQLALSRVSGSQQLQVVHVWNFNLLEYSYLERKISFTDSDSKNQGV